MATTCNSICLFGDMAHILRLFKTLVSCRPTMPAGWPLLSLSIVVGVVQDGKANFPCGSLETKASGLKLPSPDPPLRSCHQALGDISVVPITIDVGSILTPNLRAKSKLPAKWESGEQLPKISRKSPKNLIPEALDAERLDVMSKLPTKEIEWISRWCENVAVRNQHCCTSGLFSC